MFRESLLSMAVCGLAFGTESFENLPVGALTEGRVECGTVTAAAGHAEILGSHARSGQQALHLLGGEQKSVTITLAKALQNDTPLDCHLERWTSRDPFQVKFFALTPAGEKQIHTINKLATGSYKAHVTAKIPAGSTAVRIEATTDAKGGVLIDDLLIAAGKMKIKGIEVADPGAYPIMKRAVINPAVRITVKAEGSEEPKELTEVRLTTTPKAVAKVTLRTGNDKGTDFGRTREFGSAVPAEDGSVVIKCNGKLESGDTHIWVDATPADKTRVGSAVSFTVQSVTVDGNKTEPAAPTVTQSVGYLVSVPGEGVGNQPNGAAPRKCTAFRIPGLITTASGTLVGCFDARYKHSADLCADIDVAVVRSKDGGLTWTAPEVGMDTGEGEANGCGDPCIVQDHTGRLWMQALTCHFSGGASLGVSKAGFDEDKTGQWCMVYSDDDGATWSKDIVNPTRQIKKEEWTCILAGPGRGITTRDGVIVIPAQIWQNGANPRCMSTLCTSADGGKTWKYGTGIPHATSECQVAELADGSLMLNCRNERRQGHRIVYVTKDLGQTWTEHETNNKALREPTCQASLLRANKDLLLFSNPKSGQRDHMTIRYSTDEGKTWSEGFEYDTRNCWGYSCLTMVDGETVGVFYETGHVAPGNGNHGIGFLRIPLKTILEK